MEVQIVDINYILFTFVILSRLTFPHTFSPFTTIFSSMFTNIFFSFSRFIEILNVSSLMFSKSSACGSLLFGLIDWCSKPFSTIFQSYHGGQYTYSYVSWFSHTWVPYTIIPSKQWWKTNDACHSNFCQTSERMLAKLVTVWLCNRHVRHWENVNARLFFHEFLSPKLNEKLLQPELCDLV